MTRRNYQYNKKYNSLQELIFIEKGSETCIKIFADRGDSLQW